MPFPDKLGNGYILDCPIDYFKVGKRHCRLLHRPIGDDYILQFIAILPITRNQDTAVPFPYKLGNGYILDCPIDYFKVGKRHCP